MLHKIVKKAGPDLHIFLNSIVLLVALIAIALFTYMVWKHLLLKSAAHLFVYQAEIATKQRYVGADATEDATMVAASIASVPSDKPLFSNKKELENYVTVLSKTTKRDVVVMDKHATILADTIPSNVGKLYTFPDDASKVLTDGAPRRFTEVSTDYPSGVDEVVVPVKDAAGSIMGAVIMSTSGIFAE